MTEFEKAVILLLGTLIEQQRDQAAWHAHGPWADERRLIPDLSRDELRAQCPTAAEILDESILADPKTLPKRPQS